MQNTKCEGKLRLLSIKEAMCIASRVIQETYNIISLKDYDIQDREIDMQK